MHDRPHRLAAAGLAGLLLAAVVVVPAAADSPHPERLAKAEPRRVADYRPNRPITHDTDLLSASGYAAWMIDELLAATTPLPRLGAAFTRAERDTGINARYFVAHAILESGWGTSWIARAKHNLFGYGAYDRDPARFAVRYATYSAGIAAVSKEIRAAYLSPDGRWWRGFPTLRGVNRFYASDARWADKIAVLANEVDSVIVTLRERGLNFGWPHVTAPAPGAAVVAGSRLVVDVPWTSRTLGLPEAIRFAARWTPVALAEGGPVAPAVPASPAWAPVARTTHAARSVSLSVAAPTLPGSWTLEIEARDSDGSPLPATDVRPIRPLAVRVVGATEATISVGLDLTPTVAEAGAAATAAFAATAALPEPGAGLLATVRNVGRRVIPARSTGGLPTRVEAWSLPLAADGVATQLASLPIAADLPPGGQLAVRLPAPSGTAVVVLRLSGDPGAIGRSVPESVLFDASGAGSQTVTPLRVPDLRDVSLGVPALPTPSAPVVGQPAPTPVASRPGPPAETLAAISVMQADEAGEVEIGLAPPSEPGERDMPAEPPAASPSILIRTLATLPAAAADPTAAFLPWPGDRAGNGTGVLSVPDVAAGIRLVVVGLVPDGSRVADLATLRLAWVVVGDHGLDATPI